MAHLQKNLTSDVALVAQNLDPNLQNPWGIANKDAKTFWIADNDTSVISQYTKDGKWTGVQPITVTGENPTGLVTSSSGFNVNNVPATLITATRNGTIEAWNSNVGSATVIVSSTVNAVFTGLALSKNILYVANFSRGTVDVYDSNFDYVTSFTDAELVDSGYAPYNILAQSGKLYITFAKQNATSDNVLDGVGNGYVDVFDLKGVLLKRLVNRGSLNTPWGLLAAEMKVCGSVTKVLLVGNVGNGTISIFNRKTGVLLNTMSDKYGNKVVIDSVHALFIPDLTKNNKSNNKNSKSGCSRVVVTKAKCNTNSNTSSLKTVYFTAGINSQTNGLFGVLSKTNTGCK